MSSLWFPRISLSKHIWEVQFMILLIEIKSQLVSGKDYMPVWMLNSTLRSPVAVFMSLFRVNSVMIGACSSQWTKESDGRITPQLLWSLCQEEDQQLFSRPRCFAPKTIPSQKGIKGDKRDKCLPHTLCVILLHISPWSCFFLSLGNEAIFNISQQNANA